jgi:predicted O-methyltransferase YrrM
MLKRPISELSKVPGWFAWVDRETFRWILKWQTENGKKGDLLEIGAYMGKSAIVVGEGLQKDESFTVVDLFENEAQDEMNAHEMKTSYSTLTQQRFEENYLKFHKRLPKIIKGFSSEAVKHVKKASCRFIHIDASHMYNHVVHDIEDSKELALKDAIVVCDDYRSEHTPGVAAAVWQAVANGFKPVCITPGKFYGTWGNPKPIQKALREWIEDNKELGQITEDIAGYPTMRIFYSVNPKDKVYQELESAKQELKRSKAELEAIRRSRAYNITVRASRLYRRINR